MGALLESALVSVPTWTVLLLVFALPLVECSLFVGFVFPGETALVLGGVLASGALPGTGRVSLLALCVLATAGAVIGDSLGYAIGRRYGAAVQRSRLGRVVGETRWLAAESFLRRRGGPAVFLGRFTALLRALVPSAAGMAGLPFRTFLLWNAVGGAGVGQRLRARRLRRRSVLPAAGGLARQGRARHHRRRAGAPGRHPPGPASAALPRAGRAGAGHRRRAHPLGVLSPATSDPSGR